MALFRRLFYRKPPDRLLEIADRVYVFDCCFSTETMDQFEYKNYLDSIVLQRREQFADSSLMVLNFRDEGISLVSGLVSLCSITVKDYPCQYLGCPLLPLDIVLHFLRLCERWLMLEGQQNILLMHCEKGGWPVLAFMLAGQAVGFRLDSLLKLIETRATTNSRTTLMHFLCKSLAEKSPELLDFHEDLVSLEAASKLQLRALAEEQQAVVKGLEKVEQELTASESDGPVSEVFRKTLKKFINASGADVRSLSALYVEVGRSVDALSHYFGEDPAKSPFEQAHEENLKQIEAEKKKAQKEAEKRSKPG